MCEIIVLTMTISRKTQQTQLAASKSKVGSIARNTANKWSTNSRCVPHNGSGTQGHTQKKTICHPWICGKDTWKKWAKSSQNDGLYSGKIKKISFSDIPNSDSINILMPYAIFDYIGAFLRNGFAHVDNITPVIKTIIWPLLSRLQGKTPHRNSPEPSEPCLERTPTHAGSLRNPPEPASDRVRGRESATPKVGVRNHEDESQPTLLFRVRNQGWWGLKKRNH